MGNRSDCRGRWEELTARDTYLDGLRALVGGLTRA
ncbi:hypothetical protein BJY14_007211 [Actinomadura luteofluorescens]|uniref:Uncharacterized protein n=1 Tax=Actinomadura luteofluorescens TaxID=46163 RepID=A0A7Y9ENW5_9ACTN|nr:hypothetical protein [Actinomadura luteofluorescens]